MDYETIVKLKSKVKKVVKKSLIKDKDKLKCSLPFSGVVNVDNCKALRLNGGLYTQCVTSVVGAGSRYCDACVSRMKSLNELEPEYGTVEQRVGVGLYEFKDKKGRSPCAYVSIMKKQKSPFLPMYQNLFKNHCTSGIC